MLDVLNAIQGWFASNCDGDWEHSHRITIATLDNPGWAVDIDLRETSLETATFAPIELDRAENDWIRCRIQAGVFLGRGGPQNLKEILELFASVRGPSGEGLCQ